tara:strand:+ start:1 stop:1731 length:1731 start_codon:yes stop_codon:yes gene_type:complete
MARLLENQAAQLLKEASSMQGGNVEGFASVAFPLVRRVFGGLVANDLVSVQPMSLPSGLIFFLDFTQTDARLGDQLTPPVSLYGGNVVGSQITGGVSLSGSQGFYNLGNGYSSPLNHVDGQTLLVAASGVLGDSAAISNPLGSAGGRVTPEFGSTLSREKLASLAKWDADLSGSYVVMTKISSSVFTNLNESNLQSIVLTGSAVVPISGTHVRRLTRWAEDKDGNVDRNNIYMFFRANTQSAYGNNLLSASIHAADIDKPAYGGNTGRSGAQNTHSFVWATADNFVTTDAIGAVKGATPWLLESDGTGTGNGVIHDLTTDIPEIDIRVDSIAVTAITKKLKAKWTPELGQDLNAYHNLDAEVELTSILSEQIALEIDREILNDLVHEATAGTLYWSRSPGLFVNRETGVEVGASSAAPDFTGTVSEWYETLVETINDVSARIHRKTLRGGANFIVVSPEVASILEFTSGFRANVTVDSDKGTVGAVKVGSISKKWDVYVDPYFLRGVVLVGRKGGSFLESGYVYAPYVPLQVTPTIFGTEDFVPRKGVMTRYAKKMVRPDMYGLVVIRDLLGGAGG